MKDVQRVAIVDPSDATREPLRNLLLGLDTVAALRAAIDRSVPYDATKDFSGVGQMAISPSFIV